GEVYNHDLLRSELEGRFAFSSRTDTEVVLAAWLQWGRACLDRFIGMFAFAIWDDRERVLHAARDRFGVKPLYYHCGTAASGTGADSVWLASQVGALLDAGVPRRADTTAWADWLAHGIQDGCSESTGSRSFFDSVQALPAGCVLEWRDGRTRVARWYDLSARVQHTDDRPVEDVSDELRGLLQTTIELRLKADVPIGVNLSGGLDSSLLFAGVRQARADQAMRAYTFVTGSPDYDESVWVERTLAGSPFTLTECRLDADDVPRMTDDLHAWEPLPFGGVPTLAYLRTFERARADGVPVLLDGQGMDEQWAGYDYLVRSLSFEGPVSTVQGANQPLRPNCLDPTFRAQATTAMEAPQSADRLRGLQLRDISITKLPRALRYSDRVSMFSSVELREPFLDHRLVELALVQPADRKVRDGAGKWLLRQLAADWLQPEHALAPKRPVQTPQREWLRGPLREWAGAAIETALREWTWLDADAARREWASYQDGRGDNSYFVWQWVSLGLLTPMMRAGGADSTEPPE
ncbi:MAG: asparagine synthetase B, partial [Planctomycetota bacterium]